MAVVLVVVVVVVVVAVAVAATAKGPFTGTYACFCGVLQPKHQTYTYQYGSLHRLAVLFDGAYNKDYNKDET